MEGFLKYGEVIVLYANYDLKKHSMELSQSGLMVLKSKGQKVSGFLSTKGFLDTKVKFQTCTQDVDQEMLEVENITNLRDFCFVVTPRLKSEFQKDYTIALSEFKQLEKAFNNIDFRKITSEKKKDFQTQLDNFEQKVRKARKRALTEKKKNMETVKQFKGKNVTYGAEVQLMHKDSGSFLLARSECSKTEQIGYKIGISSEFNSRMIFVFQSKYKTRQEGDLIQYTDLIRLKNMKNNAYLSISLSNFESPEEHYQEETNPYITPKVLIDPVCTLHTIYIGESQFIDWQVFLYSKIEKEEESEFKNSTLYGGDLVRIRHSQINAYLTSSICFESKTPEVYFRNYNGAHEAENNCLNSIWEICHDRKLEQGEPFSSLNNRVILRHFNSGRIIQVDPKTGELNLQRLDTGYDHSKADDIVHLFPLQLGTRKFKGGLSYKIKFIDDEGNQRFLRQTEKFCSMDILDNKEETFIIKNETMFEPLEDPFYDERRLAAHFLNSDKVEEAYVIEKVEKIEQRDIMFLRSAMLPILKVARFFKNVKIIPKEKNKDINSPSSDSDQYDDQDEIDDFDLMPVNSKKLQNISISHNNIQDEGEFMKYKESIRIDNQKIVDTEYLLKRIICYLYEEDYKPNVDYKEDQFENLQPLDYRQRILKDLNFIEILIDLIHYPLKNNHYKVKEVHNELYIPDMLTTAYICIRNGIQEYRPNELYASQWLDLMIGYSLGKLNPRIQANETLTELIDNNQRILETRIKKETISRFIANLIRKGDSKFVHILRAICICDEKPMLKNQNIITELLLQDPEMRDKLVRPLTIEDGVVKILKPYDYKRGMESNDWVMLSIIKETDDLGEKYFNYYCSFIQLLGDLCQDRNYSAIETLKEYFTDEICIKVITSESYDHELRSAFCKLTENLLIDAKPFMQLQIPCNIKNWSKKREMNGSVLHGANKNKEQVKKYSLLIEFVFTYMKDYGKIENLRESASFTIQIIQLCTKMLNVGFISEHEKLEDLFNNLCVILKKTDEEIYKISKKKYDGPGDFKFRHSQAEMPEEALAIKKRACELMKILLQIQNDLRLDHIMEKFRNQNPEKKNTTENELNFTDSKENSKEEDQELVPVNGVKKVKVRSGSKKLKPDDKKPVKKGLPGIFEETVNDHQKHCFIDKDNDDLINLIINQCLYTSPELKKIALELIYLMFRESESLKTRLKDIQIIHQEKSIKQLNLLENIAETLFVLGESMEIWYMNNDQKQIKYLYLVIRRLEAMLDFSDNYNNINLKDTEITGTKFKEEINEIIKNNRFLETFLNQSFDNISLFQQNLARNTSCLEYLVDILENSFKGGGEPISNNSDKVDINYKIILILAKCCVNNLKNQKILAHFIEDLFLKKLEGDTIPSNVSIVLNKLIENNKYILLNETRSRNTITAIFNTFLKERSHNYRLAFNMNTLQRFIFFNKECLKYNQNAVISNLISTELQTIFRDLSSQNLATTLQDCIKGQNFQFNYGEKVIILLNDRLCFALSYMELISNCSFDKNAFSENIAQSLVTINHLLEVVQNFCKNSNDSMINRLVIYEIFKFCFHVYVDTEKLYTTRIGTTLLEIMDYTKNILFETLDFLNNGHKIKYYLSHKELVTSSNICIDLIFCCIDNLRVYILQVAKDANTKIDLDMLNHLVTVLVHKLEHFYEKTNRQIVKHKIAHLLCIIQEVKEKSNIIKSNATIEKKLTRNVSSIKRESEKSELFRQITDVGNFRESQLFTIMRQNLVFGERNYQKKIQINSTKFETESRNFLKSEEFEEVSEKEFKRLINWPKNPNQIEFFEYFLEELVPYLSPEVNSDSHTLNLGLTIFKNFADPDFEEHEDDFKKQRRIKIRQLFLVKIGVVELVCSLISNCEDLEVIYTAIEVGVKILEGGNIQSQNEFLKIFKKFESENIIAKILKILKLNFIKIETVMVKQNNVKLKKLVLGPKFKEFLGYKFTNFEDSNKICQLIFQFFQLLCEGHNSDLQNHLRVGTGYNEINKVKREENNAISSISALFGSYIKFFNAKSAELGEKMVDFMIETVQGPCRGNQAEMIASKVVIFCRDFLNDLNSNPDDLKVKGFYISSKNKKLADRDIDVLNTLFSTTIKLLLSILESNRNQAVIKLVGQSVKFSYLIDKLTNIFYNYMKSQNINPDHNSGKNIAKKLKTKIFDEDLEEAFDIYFFIQIINENTGLYVYDIKILNQRQKKAYTFFSTNSATIEIIFEDQLQKVHFMKHPTTNYLDKEHKTDLMNFVRRDNPNEKITDFFTAAPMLFDKMNLTFSLSKKWKLKAVYLLFVRDLAMYLSLIINGYIFLFFTLEVKNSAGTDDKEQSKTSFFRICGIIHLIMSAVMLVMQIMIKSRVILMDKWRVFFEEFRISLLQVAKEDNLQDQLMLATLQKNVSEITFEEHKKILSKRRKMEIGNEDYTILPVLNYITKNLIFILSDFGFIYFIFYFTCSLIAFSNNNPFLYAFSLFEIINRFDTLRNVIRAITFNSEQLLLTLLLQTVTIYIFSLFGYYYLIDTFWNSDFGVSGENQCTSVLQCFLTILSLGPRSSGGIGDMLVRQSFMKGNRNKYFIRFAFDCICFILVNLILLNIVFGIIIDTFAFLRDQRYHREQDKKNMCFICSIKRQSFDKTPEGFNHHIKSDHYVWNYLFYLYYLKHKDTTDYNGIESYISKLVDVDDHSWIPIGKSLVLLDLVDEELDIGKVYSECYDKVMEVVERNEKLKRESDNDMKFYVNEA